MKTQTHHLPTAGDIAAHVDYMRSFGYVAPARRVRIAIPDAAAVLRAYLSYFLGPRMQWLPEYDRVAEWLTDNHGLGLLCAGDCGRGKSLLCERVLPLVIHRHYRLVVKTVQATRLPFCGDEWLAYRLVMVDDVGTEDVSVRFGNRRDMFAELVDAAEREGHLLLLTCNYGTDGLTRRYGLRVVDRLRGLVRGVRFKGPSLRTEGKNER